TLCVLLVASSILWSVAAMGYSRYGIFEDVLAGVTVLVVSAVLMGKGFFSWRTVVAVVFCATLLIQSYVACSYNLHKEWGERSTVIAYPDTYLQEAKLILRDHSLGSFLTDEDRTRFNKVQVWFETGPKSTGFEVLLNPRAPIIALRQPEFFFTRDAWR